MLMKKSGLLAAAAPEQFGGLGVESAHDITVAISRLARGCGSTAIAANMHIGAVWVVARNWRQGIATGDTAASEGLGQFLPVLGQSQVIVSGAGTESGSSFVFPQTTATPVDGGYVINGHKIFATNSDIADSVTVFLKIPDGDGWWRSGMAIVLRGAEGMDVRGNWDAMGMRGSGSHDIVFTDCFVPARDGVPRRARRRVRHRRMAGARRHQLRARRRVPRYRRGGAPAHRRSSEDAAEAAVRPRARGTAGDAVPDRRDRRVAHRGAGRARPHRRR